MNEKEDGEDEDATRSSDHHECEHEHLEDSSPDGSSPQEVCPTASSAAFSDETTTPEDAMRFNHTDALTARSSKTLLRKSSTCISFKGQTELLRASSSETVMRFGAELFKNSTGSAETYSLSREAARIDVFISHNWAVSRWKKFACLTLFFNFNIAFAVTLVTMLFLAIATDTGYLWLEADIIEWGQEENAGLLGTVLVVPTFLLVTLTVHEWRRVLHRAGPSVFLDKTCIHQVDKDLQRIGIEKLGAFLKESSYMLVLYTDLYLTKLWTVYEVACFLSQHPTSRMIVLPTHSPMLVYGGMLILYGTVLLDLGVQAATGCWQIVYMVYIVGGFGTGWALRRWSREKVQIHQRMRDFHVQQCTCFCEEDRPIVYRNIASLMHNIGNISGDACEEEGLEAFNLMVRRRLPHALTTSVGPVGIRYLHAVSIFLFTSLMRHMDSRLGWTSEEDSYAGTKVDLRLYVSWAIYEATLALGVMPLLLAFMSRWVDYQLQLTGWKEFAWLWLGVLVQVAVGVAIDLPVQLLTRSGARDGHLAPALQLLLFVATSGCAILVYRRRRRPTPHGEEEEL